MSLDVLCVGDVMLDVHVEARALARGGDVHGRVSVRPGGTSANAAVWAAWSGARAAVVGAVGSDVAGKILIDEIAARGVDVSSIARCPAASGTMLVTLQGGDRSMVADRGANASLRPADLPDRLEAGAVLVSGYLLLQEPTTETALAAIERAATSLLAVEAGSWPLVEAFGADRFIELTSEATVLLANEEEARRLCGRGPEAAAGWLGERYRIAVVTCGRDGAFTSVDGSVAHRPTDPVATVDPTGAGDAFDGVLLAMLVAGREVTDAFDAAARAGAVVAGSTELWPEAST